MAAGYRRLQTGDDEIGNDWSPDSWQIKDNDVVPRSSVRQLAASCRWRMGPSVSRATVESSGTMLTRTTSLDSTSSKAKAKRKQKFESMEKHFRNMIQETQSRCVCSPHRGPIKAFQMCMMVLVWVSVLTAPFHAAFVDQRQGWHLAIDLFCDVFFLLDTVLQFFMAVTDANTRVLIFNHHKVIHAYITGPMFYIDIMSVVPAGRLLRFRLGEMAYRDHQLLERGLRFLKLLRLFRVPRLMAIIWRSERDFTYGTKTLMKSMLLVCVVAHTMACFWGLLGKYGGDAEVPMEKLRATGHTWLDLPQNHVSGGGEFEYYRDLEPWQLYIASLYWASFTITGIGYGDIVPQSGGERLCSVLCMLLGALVWAVIVANIVSIVAIWSATEVHQALRMDELEEIMEERDFPGHLRSECREYFQKLVFHDKQGRIREAVGKMSPKLAAEAVQALHGFYFARISWLAGMMEGNLHGPFFVALVEGIVPKLFCPGEMIQERNSLLMVLRGTALLRSAVAIRGRIWGEDVLLDQESLKRPTSAVCLTFLEVAVLHRKVLDGLMEEFPAARRHIRRHKVWLVARRGIIQAAKRRVREEEQESLGRLSNGKKRQTIFAQKYARAPSGVLGNLLFKGQSLAGSGCWHSDSGLDSTPLPVAPRPTAVDDAWEKGPDEASNPLETRVDQMETKLNALVSATAGLVATTEAVAARLDVMMPHVEKIASEEPMARKPKPTFANSRELFEEDLPDEKPKGANGAAHGRERLSAEPSWKR